MSASLPVWEFGHSGPLRERLNGLVLGGAKTTTFDLEVLSRMSDVETVIGQTYTMPGSNGAALAVIEVVDIVASRIGDVEWASVEAEGESFRSIAEWREAHEAFWASSLDDIRAFVGDSSWVITDDTVVHCVTIRVVERMPDCDVARFAVVECVVPDDEVELASADMIDSGTTGIEEIGSGPGSFATDGREALVGQSVLRATYASDEAAIAAEKSLAPRWDPRLEVLLGDDWLDAWREHFEPQRIGRVVIVGDWDGASSNDDETTGCTVVRLDPARSFGTGAHASTRLMIEALQGLPLDERSVLDVGCGSGILAVTALALGARSAHGTDTESAALQVTLSNAKRNGVGDRCTVSMADDPASSAIGQTTGSTGTYDVVLANILAPVLIELAPMLRRSLRSGGTLVLAGLIDDQVDRVIDAFAPLSLQMTLAEGRWRCLAFN